MTLAERAKTWRINVTAMYVWEVGCAKEQKGNGVYTQRVFLRRYFHSISKPHLDADNVGVLDLDRHKFLYFF